VDAVDNLSLAGSEFFLIASEPTRPDRVERPLQTRDGSPHTPERPSGASTPGPICLGSFFWRMIAKQPAFGFDPRDHVQTRNDDSKKGRPGLSFRRIF
jgi:hypothetical protein